MDLTLESIRKIRKECGLSQEDLAEELKMSTRNYQRIEDGTQHARLDILQQIAHILNAKLEIRTREETEKPNNG